MAQGLYTKVSANDFFCNPSSVPAPVSIAGLEALDNNHYRTTYLVVLHPDLSMPLVGQPLRSNRSRTSQGLDWQLL